MGKLAATGAVLVIALCAVPGGVRVTEAAEASGAKNGSRRLVLGLRAFGRTERSSRGLNDFGQIRFTLAGEISDGVRYAVSLHDGRTDDGGAAHSRMQDQADFGEAWAEFGSIEGPGWRVRVGRQALSFGDERLVGADAEWSAIPFSFDAVRVERRLGWGTLNAFVAAPVSTLPAGWNSSSRSTTLSGLYSSYAVGKRTLDVYGLHSREGSETHRLNTFGGRIVGPLGGGLEHNVELSVQSGRAQGQPTRAWAVHAEASRQVRSIKVIGEYNRASGDKSGANGLSQGYHDLYSGSYNRYGLLDPFRARNLQTGEVAVQWTLARDLRMIAGYRSYWRASASDAIWSAAATPAQATRAGTHIADQAAACLVFTPGGRWNVAAGASLMTRRHGLLAGASTIPPAVLYASVTRAFFN